MFMLGLWSVKLSNSIPICVVSLLLLLCKFLAVGAVIVLSYVTLLGGGLLC